MPLIEELPNTTTTRVSHGWAYVPDTCPLKSTLALSDRKRGAARNALGIGDVTAKQQKAIQNKLADLEKENHKDTIIAIPQRAREKGKSKITPNVRRILGYSRNFAHYLADEEAQPSIPAPSIPASPAGLNRANSTRGNVTATVGHHRTPSRQLSMQPPPRPSTSESMSVTTPTMASFKREKSAEMQPPPFPSASRAQRTPSSIGGAVDQLIVNPELDNHPLLKSKTPKPPSARVMEMLLSEPPLSYNAARAKPADDAKPRRHFCAICGYWGKVKCRKCGERTCGLMECWRAHEPQCTVY